MIYLGMLLVASFGVTFCASISFTVDNEWGSNYLVVVIAGSVAIISTFILSVLMHYENLNRELEIADTANTEFRDPGFDT
jgi:phosphotransferase system  glucose/maltose/N-acetylglucosamine-specific IIC component